MRKIEIIAALAVATIAGVVLAQQKGAPAPPLAPCGKAGDVEIICGTVAPEDFELTPDGKFLIVSQFSRTAGQSGLSLFDPGKKTFTKLTPADEPQQGWGDAACPGPIGASLSPHGTSLAKRPDGKMQLLVVNHVGRESIEMYELKQTAGSWGLAWHGCVVTNIAYNDVAGLPDGGFVGTKPTALQGPPAPKGEAKAKGPQQDVFAGQPSGYVVRWGAGRGEIELPGTRAAYPNGVVASADGRTIYFAAWTASELHKYDLNQNRETGMVKLNFMPDNITWTKKNKLLAAGVKGARGDCPAGSGTPCIQGFGVAAVDPATMMAANVYDSAGKPAVISGVSVAIQRDNAVYVGAFQGDRVVKIDWRE